MWCEFCKEKNKKIISFVNEKLIKYEEILHVGAEYNLKYNNFQLPRQVNSYNGYHRKCYSSFITIKAKYRNISANNSVSSTTNMSSSSLSLLDPPISVRRCKMVLKFSIYHPQIFLVQLVMRHYYRKLQML